MWDFPIFPKQASTVAWSVDALTWFILAYNVLITAGVFVCLIFCAIFFRQKRKGEVGSQSHGGLLLELTWAVIPTIICLITFWWGVKVYAELQVPPADATDVYVVGRQWMWKMQYPTGHKEINTLHVPLGKPVKLTITSEDVLHSVWIPAFRVKSDAVPGRYTTLWFEATVPGEHKLFCTEYCGTEHSRMIGKVVVLEEAEYQKWLSEQAEFGDALQGRKLFTKLQCVTCHAGESQAKAPLLEELYMKKIPLAFDKGSPVAPGTSVLADENYLRESIRYPSAKIVAGWQHPSIMPAYDESLVSEDDLFQVIAYIKSLRRGQTPPRIEVTTQPRALGAPQGK